MSEGSLAPLWSIPSSWAWVTTGEITDIIGGGTPSTSEPSYWDRGTIPWLTPADLSGYRSVRILRGGRDITPAGLSHSSARMLPAGSVLMSSRAPVGYVAIAAQELATNQGFKSFVPTAALMPEYLYYFILGNRALLLERASGTTFQEISGKAAATIPVPIAPIAEQRRVVAAIEEHLSRLDAAIAGLSRATALVASYRASMLTAAAKGRLAGAPSGPFCLELLESLVAEPPRNGRSVPTADGGFPVLRLTAVRNNRMDLSERKGGEWSHSDASSFLVSAGDFFVVRGNGSRTLVGRGALVVGQPDPVAFPDTMIRVRVRKELMLPEFLSAIWDAQTVRSQIDRAARTSAGIYKINQSDLSQIRVPVPGIDAQLALVAEIERRTTLMSAVDTEIRGALGRAARLRQSILKRAFEGKLVPQDPRDEPARVLLDRIGASRATTGAKFRTRRRSA